MGTPKDAIQIVCDDNKALAEGWMTEISYGIGYYDALSAVTLCLLPNLESLNVDIYGQNRKFPYIQHVLERAANIQESQESSEEKGSVPPYRLERLSNVSLSFHKSNTSISFLDALCFIRPRSVRTFFCKGLANGGGTMEFTSYVREITFDDCPVSELMMNHALSHCVALQSFKRMRCGPFNPTPFPFGLQPSIKTLETLVLRDDDLHSNPIFSSRFRATDWSKFEKLERLDISWYALTEQLQVADEDDAKDDEKEQQEKYQEITREFLQRLPPSLGFLRMFSCPSILAISPFVKALAMSKELYVPSLEEVVLALAACGKYSSEGKVERGRQRIEEQNLVELYEYSGMRLTWEKTSDLE